MNSGFSLHRRCRPSPGSRRSCPGTRACTARSSSGRCAASTRGWPRTRPPSPTRRTTCRWLQDVGAHAARERADLHHVPRVVAGALAVARPVRAVDALVVADAGEDHGGEGGEGGCGALRGAVLGFVCACGRTGQAVNVWSGSAQSAQAPPLCTVQAKWRNLQKCVEAAPAASESAKIGSRSARWALGGVVGGEMKACRIAVRVHAQKRGADVRARNRGGRLREDVGRCRPPRSPRPPPPPSSARRLYRRRPHRPPRRTRGSGSMRSRSPRSCRGAGGALRLRSRATALPRAFAVASSRARRRCGSG